MYHPQLSNLPEDKVEPDKRIKSKTSLTRTNTADKRYGQNTLLRSNMTRLRVNAGLPQRRFPPLNRGKQVPIRRPGRVSISEGFPLPEGLPKISVSDTTAESAEAAEASRRASVPQTKKSGKMLFAGLGRKVTSMVRARFAFQADRKSMDEILEANTMEAIHEMPKAPRFSSFLSPEAQYAMMMGYEDVLHQQLSRNHPEYRSVLRRNKTPMFRVGIVQVDLGNRQEMPKTDANVDVDENSDASDQSDSEQEEKKENQNGGEEDDSGDFYRLDSPSQRPRSNIPAATTSTTTSSPSRLRRSKTYTIPFDRRLHLTYRMESAMDILDTIRRVHHGQPPMSPRVRANKRTIAPVRDYNSWANVWKKEFSPCDDKKGHQKVKV